MLCGLRPTPTATDGCPKETGLNRARALSSAALSTSSGVSGDSGKRVLMGINQKFVAKELGSATVQSCFLVT